jgi:hypothetical protein
LSSIQVPTMVQSYSTGIQTMGAMDLSHRDTNTFDMLTMTTSCLRIIECAESNKEISFPDKEESSPQICKEGRKHQ